jgi:hypothetical protein
MAVARMNNSGELGKSTSEGCMAPPGYEKLSALLSPE